MAGTVTFRRDRCKGCELCTLVCPKHIIVMDESTTNRKGYHPATVRPRRHGEMRGLRQLRQNLSRFYHHRRTHIRRILWRKNCGKAMRPLPRPPFVPAANTSSAIPSPRKTKFLNICPSTCPRWAAASSRLSLRLPPSTWSTALPAAASGAMTSSSSPGISLKQEGITYMCGAELPAVIVNMMRGGPGLGTIQPAQGDYYQATRGGGNGDYRHLVFAPRHHSGGCGLCPDCL